MKKIKKISVINFLILTILVSGSCTSYLEELDELILKLDTPKQIFSKKKLKSNKNKTSIDAIDDLIKQLDPLEKESETKVLKKERKISKNKIEKINDNFYCYVTDKDDLYFVFEKINNENIDFWYRYYHLQKNTIEKIDYKKNGGITGFGNNLELWKNHKWLKDTKDDLWICYATVKKLKSKASNNIKFDNNGNGQYLINDYIEMAMGVFTNNKSIISTHMGIHRTPQFDKEGKMCDKRHRGLSILLHQAAAKFTRYIYYNVHFMVTCPLDIMRNIMSREFSDLEKKVLWVGDKIQNESYKKWNEKVSELLIEYKNTLKMRNTTKIGLKRKSLELILNLELLINFYNKQSKKNINTDKVFKELKEYFGIMINEEKYKKFNINNENTDSYNIFQNIIDSTKKKFILTLHIQMHSTCLYDAVIKDDEKKVLSYLKNLAIVLLLYNLKDREVIQIANKYKLKDLENFDINKQKKYISKIIDILLLQSQRNEIFKKNEKSPLMLDFENKSIIVSSKNGVKEKYKMPEYFDKHIDIYQESLDRPLTILYITKF